NGHLEATLPSSEAARAPAAAQPAAIPRVWPQAPTEPGSWQSPQPAATVSFRSILALLSRFREQLPDASRLPRQIAKALIPKPYRAPVKAVGRAGKRVCKRVIEVLVEQPTWAMRGVTER